MSQYDLLINGKLTTADEYDAVINPATGETVGHAARASAAQVDLAVTSAKKAFPDWASDAALRSATLQRAADAVQAQSEELARLITLEQGRPLRDTRGEVAGAIGILRHYANFELPPFVPFKSDDSGLVVVERKPLGVVAAITPWNVPIILLLLKIIPALKAGNTVVAKPSEYTPLSTLLLGRLFAGIFPAGVLNILAGAGQVGSLLAKHSQVNKITFTGSVATGKSIYGQASLDLKRITLELGGNDPAIVLADADVEKIVEPLFWGAFWNTGQICFAIKRVYAHKSIAKRLAEALAKRAAATKVGNGLDEGVELGPLNNQAQLLKIEQLVKNAKIQGATILQGGSRIDGPGYFYPPTIVTDISHSSALVQEEQFGPVLPIVEFEDEAEAIQLANDSQFGLGGSVWSGDYERGLALARQLDVGLAWVNQHGDIHPAAPKGGFKESGLGYEGGAKGFEEFYQLQVINAKK